MRDNQLVSTQNKVPFRLMRMPYAIQELHIEMRDNQLVSTENKVPFRLCMNPPPPHLFPRSLYQSPDDGLPYST